MRFFNQPPDQIIPVLQDMFYGIYQRELEKERAILENRLEGCLFQSKMRELNEKSMELFRAYFAKIHGTRSDRKIFDKDDLWKNPTVFLKEYPVILSTTYSIRTSLSRDCVFDYVIIDEASQVDIATGALAFANARKAVIVGDLMQLPNVLTGDSHEAATLIGTRCQIEECYDYTKHSLLSSVMSVWKEVPKTLLRKHYRCHPKIIGFCNQKFYNNQLIVMTEDHGEEDVLKLYYTKPGNHARKHVNQRQIDVITEEIISELAESPDKIGVVAPYRAQADAVAKQFENSDPGLEADTVHKYQGREKDNIIITTVDNKIGEFADNPNLLNVAVSRAAKRLRLVVSPEECNENTNTGDLGRYIKYQNFEVVNSKVSSVFDLLYKHYAEKRREFLERHRRVSEYDSENLMYGLIRYLLAEESFSGLDCIVHPSLRMLIRKPERLQGKQLCYAMHPATHLDFLIYNKMDKSPVLAVEVDGTAYHQKGSCQYRRDRMKDEILAQIDIPLLRFSTDGSSEKQRLRKKLLEVLNKPDFSKNIH